MINNKAKLDPGRQLFGPYFLTKIFLSPRELISSAVMVH